MPVSRRRTWVVGLSGPVLATGLFAAYVLFRDRLPPGPLPATVEQVLVFAALAAGAAWLVGRNTRRRYWKILREVAAQVAALRQHPATHQVRALPPELGPLRQQVEALAGSYRHALAELVDAQQALALLRALQVRADAERGHSHSFVHRGGAEGSVLRRMVARLTPSLHWVAATPALQLFLGRSMNDLVARSFLELVHPEDAPGLARAFQEALRDGEGHNIIFRLRARGEEERHVQMDVLTRYTDAGTPLHLRCHFLDITDQVRTEQELRRRTEELSQANARLQQINADLARLKESYRDLYHQAPVMYFSLDEQGRFAAFNETLTRSLGYERKELFRQPYTRLLAPDSCQRYLEDPSVYHRAGEVETRWVKKDGTVIDVWVRTTPILDADGRFVRSRSAAQDVTERNRLADALRTKAEELERANAQLRRINQELDQFTHVVSHDLKEPLRTVQAFSTFLRQDYGRQLGPEGQEYINHLVQASRRLGLLIDDLLALSRAGRTIRPPRAFPLADAVRTVCADLRDLIQRTGATVRTEGELPVVAGDPERVIQLLANLVGNGLKYNTSPRPEVVIGTVSDGSASDRGTDDGEVRDGVRDGEGAEASASGDAVPGTPSASLSPDPSPLTARPSSSAHVTIYVRDNGIGIDPQYHEQIFGIFRRLHHRDEYEGTGAGLAICKKIVESHGGRIWVESRPGAGATFYFTLPRPGGTEQRDEGAAQEAGAAASKPIRAPMTERREDGGMGEGQSTGRRVPRTEFAPAALADTISSAPPVSSATSSPDHSVSP
ncbi:MAG TPA: ATP-binding protein [Gemmataceae bacterium]|nr:ATP-binding protein [Gemmataceae bacterium]